MASETTILNLTEKQLSELQSNGYVMVSRPNGSFKVKLSDFQAASGAATQSWATDKFADKQSTAENFQGINATINTKANSEDVYTKNEIDGKGFVSSAIVTNIVKVTELPETPDENTLYLIVED